MQYYGPDAKQIRAERRSRRKNMQKKPVDPFCERRYDNVNKFTSEVGGASAGTYRFARREGEAQLQEFFEPPSKVSVRDQKEQQEADTAILIPPRWVDLTRKLRLADLTRKVYAGKNALPPISNEDQLLSDLDYGSYSSKQIRAERRNRPKSRRDRNGKYWSKIRLNMLCFTPNDRLKANRARILDIKEEIAAVHEIETSEDVPIEPEDTPLEQNEVYTEETQTRARCECNCHLYELKLQAREARAAKTEAELKAREARSGALLAELKWREAELKAREARIEQNEAYTEETLLKLYLESNNSPRTVYSLDMLDFKPPEALEADDLFTSLARDIDNTLYQFCNWVWSALIFE